MASIGNVNVNVGMKINKNFEDFMGRRHMDQAAYFLRNQPNRNFLAWAAKQDVFDFADIRREFLGVKSHPWIGETLETGWITALGANFKAVEHMPNRMLSLIGETIGDDQSRAPNSPYEIDAQVTCLSRPVYLHVYQRIASKPRTTHELKQGFMCSRDQMLTGLRHLQDAGLVRQKWEGLSRMWVPTGQKMPGLVRYLKSIRIGGRNHG